MSVLSFLVREAVGVLVLLMQRPVTAEDVRKIVRQELDDQFKRVEMMITLDDVSSQLSAAGAPDPVMDPDSVDDVHDG